MAQDTERLAQAYPQAWEGFLGNADLVFWMGTNHSGSVHYLERALGQTTRREKTGGGLFTDEKPHTRRVERPLMYAEQIRCFLDPAKRTMIITRFGKQPLKVLQTPFFTELPVWAYTPDPDYGEKPLRAFSRRTLDQAKRLVRDWTARLRTLLAGGAS